MENKGLSQRKGCQIVSVRTETDSLKRKYNVYRIKFSDSNKYFGDGTRKPVVREVSVKTQETVPERPVSNDIVQTITEAGLV